jgi:hypothetical protein
VHPCSETQKSGTGCDGTHWGLQALIDLDLEVELTGFAAPDVDTVLDEAAEANGEPPGPSPGD